MCVAYMEIKDKEDAQFFLTNLILSKNEDFTFGEILNEVNDYEFQFDLSIKNLIKKTLNNLCENGIVQEFISTYSVCK